MGRGPRTGADGARCGLGVGAVLLAGCASVPPAPPAGAACSGSGLAVGTGFERARASACTITGPDRIEVVVRPETVPVNDSAWYAFRIDSSETRTVSVTLRYRDGTHRYHPQTSVDGVLWEPVPADGAQLAVRAPVAQFTVTVPPGGITVAAQPLETVAAALGRWEESVAAGRLERRVFGTSVRGAPLVALATPAPAARDTLVLVARQHPPEATGALAFDAFLARLLEDDPLASRFRGATAILALPVLNPDGIAAGHWRTNAGLVDLNRDWGAGTQPETRAATALIEAVHGHRPVVALVDFHSTRRSVLYAHPAGDALHPPGLVEAWFARWQSVPDGRFPPVSRSFTPEELTSKTWGRVRLGISPVTYEEADTATPADIRRSARASAEALMETILDWQTRQTASQGSLPRL